MLRPRGRQCIQECPLGTNSTTIWLHDGFQLEGPFGELVEPRALLPCGGRDRRCLKCG